jgi:hypothetical protein
MQADLQMQITAQHIYHQLHAVWTGNTQLFCAFSLHSTGAHLMMSSPVTTLSAALLWLYCSLLRHMLDADAAGRGASKSAQQVLARLMKAVR